MKSPSHPGDPLLEGVKNRKPQSSWITLRSSVNDGIFFSYQQVGKVILKGVNEHSKPSSHLTNTIYWYETTALCDKEISKTLPERVRSYLNSKFKITFLSKSVEAPRSSSEFLSCHCIPTQLSLSPTRNSLGTCLREVFPQNPLWCIASLFHAQ